VNRRIIYPGAVTWEWVDKRVRKLCTPIPPERVEKELHFEWPLGSGCWWKPNSVFQSRVMGEFPTDSPDSLFPLHKLEQAIKREIPLDESAPVDLGVDVAYKGGDAFVVIARQGMSVIRRLKWYDRDAAESQGRILAFCRELRAEGKRIGTIAVDAIGMGSGVVPHLMIAKDEGWLECDQLVAVQVSEKANDSETYYDKRTELTYALSERFKAGQISLLPLGKDTSEDFVSQAVAIKQEFHAKSGKSKVADKDTLRKLIGVSPDDVDAMMLAFIDTVDNFADAYSELMSAR
jgi:hypothetical protein